MPNYKHVISYLGEKRVRELHEVDKKLVYVTGYYNYTPAVMEKLHEMHDAGIIPSPPVNIGGDIYWLINRKIQNFVNVYRENDLPSVERKGRQDWCNKSSDPDRENGPCRIHINNGKPIEYLWVKPGDRSITASAFQESKINTMSREEYINYIKKNFPNAKQEYLDAI
jgi:hypothetical protein